ncbi:MAG: hypothetical protein A2162_04050 [Deltaproteobacteria bacterium RBG_13_52_11b]|nr:MAG: hypothetical protein A2162_04050 [Deltaproteobacteria bacterium RBG_13_52_11b]
MNNSRNRIIEEIAGAIDIPDSAYEKAQARYKDLGGWFGRKEARCYAFGPHICSQGSFRLGTVIRPVDEDGEYDLDMGCRLNIGIAKSTHTQQRLKELVGADLEDYRIARGINDKQEEKHRCWRLKYADILKFHLDIVPSIPETPANRRLIQEAMIRTGASAGLAVLVANLTGAITDNRMWNYRIIDDGWRLSNSEGFARWFESRIRLEKALMERLALQARAAKLDELPAYKWKSPLQRCVQLLKRHRDIMFADDPEGRPASIIITTLSAMAYMGEAEIADALERILSGTESLINPYSPRVPNPVNPDEDFADRWTDQALGNKNLEANFWSWLRQAKLDFETVGKQRNPELIVEAARAKLGVSLNADDLKTKLGIGSKGDLLKPAAVPAGLKFPDKPLIPKKPAGFA